jgi:hypothetical protein
VAFIGEHRQCGVLDGGRDNGYVWLQCSCGGLTMQPASEKPPRHPAAGRPQLAAPSKEATMATYRIVCTVETPSGHSNQQTHIVAVGVGDDPNEAQRK